MEDRYAPGWVREVCSSEAKVARWTAVLAAWEGLTLEAPAVADVEAIEARTGHDVAAWFEAVRMINGSASLGAGLTSSNIVDTGLSLWIREVSGVDALTGIAGEVRETLEYWATSRDAIPRVARTHGRPAEHDDFRRQMAVWAARVGRAEAKLAEAASRAAIVSFGGPIGAGFGSEDPRVAAAAARLGLGVVPGPTDQALDRDRIARWAEAVAALASAFAHIATQVRLGARDGDLREPTGVSGYKGSSSMPHKRNPTRSERVVGLERVVRALTGAVAESAVWWDQRDITASSVERVALPQIVAYTAFAGVEVREILTGLELDRDLMAAVLEANPGSADRYAAALREVATAVEAEEAYRRAREASS